MYYVGAGESYQIWVNSEIERMQSIRDQEIKVQYLVSKRFRIRSSNQSSSISIKDQGTKMKDSE